MPATQSSTYTRKGFLVDEASSSTTLKKGDRAKTVGMGVEGTVLGFTRPRGYAVFETKGGEEILVHPETIRPV